MENRTMVQHNGNTYNSGNSWTQMRGSSECVSVYVSELRRREAWTKLSEGNGVWRQCGGMYRELERRSVSRMSRWTYSIRGIGERRCPLTLTNSLATFQTIMDTIFEDLISEGVVVVYLDDILIFTKTLEEHQKVVQIFFSNTSCL